MANTTSRAPQWVYEIASAVALVAAVIWTLGIWTWATAQGLYRFVWVLNDELAEFWVRLWVSEEELNEYRDQQYHALVASFPRLDWWDAPAAEYYPDPDMPDLSDQAQLSWAEKIVEAEAYEAVLAGGALVDELRAAVLKQPKRARPQGF